MRFPAVAFLAVAFLSGTAQAQTPQSVNDLLKDGYDIINVSPIAESYAVFLEKDNDVIICQIGFKDDAFATDKCYPLTR